MSNIGMFIGRFQPFHRGHLDAILQLETLMWGVPDPEIAVVVGGPREFRSDSRHFWCFGDIKSMIEDSCKEVRIPMRIYHVPDVGDYPLYGKNAIEAATSYGSDKMLYICSGNPDTLLCFQHGKDGLFFEPKMSNVFKHGTELRLMILADLVGLDHQFGPPAWAKYVPRGTEAVIKEWALFQQKRLGLPC